MNVLVVDDSLTIRTTLRRAILDVRPHAKVDEALDVEGAIGALRRERYDVVFLDLALPHRGTQESSPRPQAADAATGGRLVWEVLLGVPEPPRVVLTTAHGPEHPDVRAILSNARATYLPKPLRHEGIRAALSR